MVQFPAQTKLEAACWQSIAVLGVPVNDNLLGVRRLDDTERDEVLTVRAVGTAALEGF